MDTKKIEYLKKHLTQALAEENYGDANYCFKELSNIPDVDVSEFAAAVSNLNAKYKSKIDENCTSDFEKLKEQIRHGKKNLNIVSKIQVWGLAGGVGLLLLALILVLLSTGEIIDHYYNDNLMYFGVVIACLGGFGILVGTVFSFIINKVYKPVNDTRRKLFNELCLSQEKFKYLDNVEIINGYDGLPQYMGQVANGKKEGFGISVNPYGYFYVGEWLNGEKSGIGKLMTDDFKMILEGEFLSDYANGIVDITWEDGSEWHGEYKEGFPWSGKGKAVLLWNGKSKIIIRHKALKGIWKNGIKLS